MMRIFILSVIALVLAAGVYGQQPSPRVAGLETNERYMELLSMEQVLRHTEDSLGRVLTGIRGQLRGATAEQRIAYGADILRLEGEIFEIRSQSGIVAGQIDAIEQEFIIMNLGTAAQTEEAAAMPVYLRRNLSDDDLGVWEKASSMERAIERRVESYIDNYRRLRQLADDYASETSSGRADSILALYVSFDQVNAIIADSIAGMWEFVFDNKSYLCNLLMDKENNAAYLASAEERSRKLRSETAQSRGTLASDAAGLYPPEKLFLLESERQIAEYIGDKRTADSLLTAMEPLRSMPAMTKINIAQRSFIDFQEVQILKTPAYDTAGNPVPELTAYPHGTVYRILLGNFLKQQPMSIFRNAWPMEVEKGDDGRFRYYAGRLETEAKAEETVDMLLKAGFKSPQIVVWRNGTTANVSEEKRAAAASGRTFRIEIGGSEEALPADVLDILAGEGAISRIASKAEDGAAAYTFIVGSYDNRAAAEDIAARVRTARPALSLSVVELSGR